MVKKVTKAELDKLKRKGAVLKTKPKPEPKPTRKTTSDSSPEMIAAIRAAEAAAKAADAAKDLGVKMVNDNKVFLANMVEVIQGNQVKQFKFNRNKDKTVDTVDIIREAK